MALSDTFFLIYAFVIATAAYIHLLRIDYWWIRIWDFPHFQLMVLAGAGLFGWLLVSRDFTWPNVLVPLLLGAALSYQFWLIYPYTPVHRVEVRRQRRRSRKVANGKQPSSDEDALRLLIANVYMYNNRCPDVVKLVRTYKPDVVLVLEGNETWRQALQELEADYPHQVLCPLENTYGMLFYSRLPVRHEELRFLIQDDIPSMYTELLLPSGQWIQFYGVHPMPPSPTEHYRSTERDAEMLLVGQEARRRGGPTIVAGDLNDVAWSHTTRLFRRVSGLLDPRIGRGLFSTFHAHYFFLRWPLDHVFVSHHFRLKQIRRLPNNGSDHFPIFVSLAFQPNPKQPDNLPEPEGDDLEEARGKIDEARAEDS